MTKSNKESARHYQWGDCCDGWHLYQADELSIIEERMPPSAAEAEHHHEVAEQFFYILSGTAAFQLKGQEHKLGKNEGLYVQPGTRHQIRNDANEDLEFLVISRPKAHGDRVEQANILKEGYNLNGRRFTVESNSGNGEVSAKTLFSYHQKGDIVWATYEGGSVKFGTLSGSIVGNKLSFTYQHQNLEGEFMTGKCQSTIDQAGGKLRLNEQWQWTCGDFSSGSSTLTEVG